jgi:anti-sigma B factor antagonist
MTIQGDGVGFAVSARRDDDDEVVVEVQGEVDMAAAPEFSASLRHALEDCRGRVLIDLAGVTFIDSQGLKALVRAYKSYGHQHRRVILRAPQPQTRRVLEISGLDQVFPIED